MSRTHSRTIAVGCRLAMVGALLAATAVASPSYTGAIAAGATAGAVAGAAARTPPEGPREIAGVELLDWIDPRTRTTGTLRAGCAHLFELHLSRTARRAFLDVYLANHSGHTSSLDFDQVVVRFAGGLTRTLHSLSPSNSPLRDDWWQHVTFEFPSKEDFGDRDTLIVDLPLSIEGRGPCVVHAEMARAKGVPTDARTYTPYDSLEVYLGGGARFAAAGGLSEIASPVGAGFELGFGAFPWVNHGFFFDLALEGYGGSDAARKVAPDLVLGKGPHVSGGGFFAGYAFRLYPARWFDVSLRPSIGLHFLDAADQAKDGPSRERSMLGIRSKLRFSFRFAHMQDGTQFWLAPSVVHLFVPSGSFGPADVSGHTFGGLLEIVVGG